jgi:virginiamycin B lyase
MWFVELNGRMDDRVVDGNRVARITLDGKVTEFPIPSAVGSPINIAVGPDRNIWFTKAGRLGRVTPDGVVTEFEVPAPNSGPTGLTAGSDRRPPDQLIDRLWFTESGGNKIAYLEFQ